MKGGKSNVSKKVYDRRNQNYCRTDCAQIWLERVYLFGSYARGDATENSDVDLRVDKGSLKGMFALCGLYTEIEEALQMKVDILTTGSLEDAFLHKIQSEEVLLYEGAAKC